MSRYRDLFHKLRENGSTRASQCPELFEETDQQPKLGDCTAMPDVVSGNGEEAVFPRPEVDRVLDGLQEQAREQITKLVQRLFSGRDGSKVVVFTGVERNCGCTWLIAHAAELLSVQRRGSVCLVDANLRFPALHKLFAVSNHHGFTDAVVEPAPLRNFVQRLPTPNLWFLSCGSPDKSERALLSLGLLSQLAQLRAEFDFVLIDAPAMNLYSDAVRLGSACDGLVLVLKANSTRRETALRVLQDLKAANVRLLGAVLNKRSFPIPEVLYSKL